MFKTLIYCVPSFKVKTWAWLWVQLEAHRELSPTQPDEHHSCPATSRYWLATIKPETACVNDIETGSPWAGHCCTGTGTGTLEVVMWGPGGSDWGRLYWVLQEQGSDSESQSLSAVQSAAQSLTFQLSQAAKGCPWASADDIDTMPFATLLSVQIAEW